MAPLVRRAMWGCQAPAWPIARAWMAAIPVSQAAAARRLRPLAVVAIAVVAIAVVPMVVMAMPRRSRRG